MVQIQSRAKIQMVAAALLFSTGGAAIKACSLSSWQIASFRSGIAAAVLLVLWPAARRGWSWRTMLVAVAYAATVILFVLANKLTVAANAIFLQSTAPLYVLLLGPWLLHESLHKRDGLTMVLVAAGLAMFFIGAQDPQATAPDPFRGNILAACAGVSWALTIVGLRWLGRRDDPARGGVLAIDEFAQAEAGGSLGLLKAKQSSNGSTIAAVAAGNVIAFVVALPLALPLGESSATDWVIVVFLGVVQIGLAYVFLTAAISHIPALSASVLLLIEPVLNPVWAGIIHGEVPGGWAMFGGALILTAAVLKNTALHRQPET